MKILVTGGYGAVGKILLPMLQKKHEVIAPTHTEFDILDASIFIEQIKPDIILHCAGIAQATIAEPERGDQKGITWLTNVVGAQKIADAAKKVGAFVIHMSTASVFTSAMPRIFFENDLMSADEDLSWYAVTKKYAEQYVSDGAIIRLSHPDPYIHRLIDGYKHGKITAIFADQQFSITLLADVTKAIDVLVRTRAAGIYHIVSHDSCSPHAILCHALKKDLPITLFAKFQKQQKFPIRFSQYHIIDGKKTAADLGIPQKSWQEVAAGVI